MIVCIAEKPSVARDIANVIGATRPCSGYMEGNGYQVTWTFGHLCELKEPHEYDPRWKRWDVWDLPIIPARYGIKLKEDEGIKKQFAIIEKLVKDADMIINCGDAGQEGELIQRWVMQKAQVSCPVKRLWISSLTEDAIREGFNTLKEQSEYQSLYEAGLSRAIGDWTLGINATRLYTMKYGQNKQVLSIGRVQTPTLALIVRRYQEIMNFVPETYWVLSTIYRGVIFTSTKGKFTSLEEGTNFLQKVENSPFTITDISSKAGTEAPPRLYDLTSLQVDCNKKFGYSADLTLQLIQSLYEKKYTTYPRVDTTYLSDDIYPKCPNILKGIRGYEKYTESLCNSRLHKSKKVFNSSKVTDHHAIIPTGVPASNLTDMERSVYDLVVRSFISVFYPDCKFLTTTVMGKVEDVEFKVTGKQITDYGWKVVYQDQISANKNTESHANDEEEGVLPEFVAGESGPHTPNLQEKCTQPPKHYTEATLLRAMETAGKFVDDDELRDALKENGIGRPSTRAAIIETLFKRRYIRKEKKNVIPTATGIELIGLIREDMLKSAELTGVWERKLRKIEKHEYDTRTFLQELKQMVGDIVNNVRQDNSKIVVTVAAEDNQHSVKGKAKKTENDLPKSSPKSEKVASDNKVAGFQPKGNKKTNTKAKSLKTSNNISTNGECSDEWIGLPCPECHVGKIIKGHTAYGCSRWKEGCTFRRNFESKH